MSEQEKRDFRAFEDIGKALDHELQRLIDFVNNRVVPAAREDSEAMLRRTAEKLQKLADRMAAGKQHAGETQKPAEEKPAEEKPAEEKLADEKPAEEPGPPSL